MSLTLCVACSSASRPGDGASKIDPTVGSVAKGNEDAKPFKKNGNDALSQRQISPDFIKKPKRKKGRKKGRKKKPRSKLEPGPKVAPYKGGAYSETQQTLASRGPQIVLPAVFNTVVTQLDQPLPKKQKVACVVVEGSYLRKVKTRGICKLLRNQNSNGEVVAWDTLKQSHTLNSLITLARSQSIDLLVILEKRGTRSFVILDTRNAAVLCHTTKSQQNLVSGDTQLAQLHGKIYKAWTAQ